MYCQNCGTFNKDESIFCEACGTKLQREQTVDFSSKQNVASSVETAPKQMPKQMPKKISKRWMIVAVEVIALLLIVFGAVKIGKDGFSAERMATNYFVSMANADWKSAYNKLDVEESPFINADMFALANKKSNMESILNYEVQDPKTDMDNLLKSNSGLGRVVDIDYRLKGSQSNSTYEVTLNKQSGKQLLFFDNWKVSTENLICKDYSIYVPEGAKVVVDGITLGDSYKNKKNDSEADSFNSKFKMVDYTIPNIFDGTHTIRVSLDDYNDVKATVNISADSAEKSYVVNNLQLKPEVVKKLMQLAGEDFKKIYTAAITGKTFSTIQNLFASDQSKDIQDSYKSLLSNFNENRSSTLNNVDFSKIKASASATSMDVSLAVDYSIQYSYSDWWDGQVKTDNNDDKATFKFNFVKEKGNWVLTDLGCNSLYYY